MCYTELLVILLFHASCGWLAPTSSLFHDDMFLGFQFFVFSFNKFVAITLAPQVLSLNKIEFKEKSEKDV